MEAPQLAAGWTPNRFEFYEEGMATPDQMGDVLARIVMQRFRDARRFKSNNTVYQQKSTIRLLREADYALEKRYTPEQIGAITTAFGFCPSRYYGLAASKTISIANWKSEIVSSDPGSLIQIVPTPDPRLPRASVNAIKEGVKQELIQRMVDGGVGDPQMLISIASGRLHESVKSFLDEKALALREIEKAKIVSAAMSAASRIQTKMRDVILEGEFRQAYGQFSFNQIKYGVAFMRFPYWVRKIILSDNQDFKGKLTRMWKTIPTFANVSPWNMFITADGRDISSATAAMEYREVNKVTLVGLASDKRYDRSAITEILEDYAMRSRTWLFPESADTVSESGEKSTYWGPEELVAVIHHEGYLTGRDLSSYGLTGYDDMTVYNVKVEVCCGRTIRVEVDNPTVVLPRSYAATKFEDLGEGVWNAVGVPGILFDTQERLNVMLHAWENNLDWSLRPPLQTNPEALKNPGEARMIKPGGKYEISDLIGPGVSPDPIRTIRGPTAQYQIVWPLILQIIRQADSEVGVPDLADLSSLGKGSLGEFSARISQAVRRVRNAAFSEDTSMGPLYQTIFEYVLEENPALVENADLNLNYIGVVGLLTKEQEKQAKVERLGVVTQAVQAGVAPPEVAQFAYQDLLKDLGIPTEALGFSDPLTENAIAIATSQGTSVAGGGGVPQVPKLDGRSGAISSIPSAVAAPNGASTAVPPPAGIAPM